MKFKIFVITALLLLLPKAAYCADAFGGLGEFDTLVWDFGDVSVKDGPLKCAFTFTNRSSSDLMIQSVVSSCGCTGVQWTRSAIAPGATALIEATYSNDEGPYPFDKTLSVYLAGVKKPVILHLKGIVHPKKMPLGEIFTLRCGPLGLRSAEYKLGNLVQGEMKSSTFQVANLGKKEIRVSWNAAGAQLSFSPAEQSVAPGSTAQFTYTIKADRSLWGKNFYKASPVIDGECQAQEISFQAITKEDFRNWNPEKRAAAAVLDYAEGSAEFRDVQAGSTVEGKFVIKNTGKSPMHIWRVQSDDERLEILAAPAVLKAGASGAISFRAHAAESAEGGKLRSGDEILLVLSIYSDAPNIPQAHFYVNLIIR